MLELIKKHKERFALIGMGIGFVIFIGGGIYLQKSKKQEKEPLAVTRPVRLELSTAQKAAKQGRQSAAQSSPASTAYYLKPSPDELIEQLASMENLTEEAIDEKFAQLSVLWPVYFFTLRETEDGGQNLLLDVSKDGFGVVIESKIDLSLYPELGALASGEKIWIGGKILAVDPAGTGTIYLEAEQLKVGADPPFSPHLPSAIDK